MHSALVREAFLEFFARQGHTRVASSSLVPGEDPTLLFTNAGMNQFKDCFLGLEKRTYRRAVSAQKCVRAGGKHNDLDNVGYTARHHTFFEMLGNFSFGDYFKKEAIHMAWTFLTSAQWLALPAERLWITVYASDEEAWRLWAEDIGVPSERIIRIGDNKGAAYASDNFWAMGDTGPCGPCTEIFYDHGPEIAGGPPGSPDEDGDRFIEIWNNVFMQFNRTPDGVLHPLPAPSVDTGMGLERISAVLQGVHSNYEIDLFRDLISTAARLTGTQDLNQPSLRVLADHIRSCSFLVADGVLPANEGRGYVLRRIIRRACRHGHKLGAEQTFFYALVPELVRLMGDAYPELVQCSEEIQRVLRLEEELFAHTLSQGMKVLEQALQHLDSTIIPGSVVFTLADTYGFPPDLTADVAREKGFTLEMEGFEQALAEQRQRSRSNAQFGTDYTQCIEVAKPTVFCGYEETQATAQIIGLYQHGQAVSALSAGALGLLVLDTTPFYARSGGQVGDTGRITADGAELIVRDTSRQGQAHVHHVEVVRGHFQTGQVVQATIDAERRLCLRAHHSATHLLHAALRTLVGKHVTQQGSQVTPEALRFDFSHPNPLTAEQLRQITLLVNAEIRHNSPVTTELLSPAAARQQGAMALFGEKYGEVVRVLGMGQNGFSLELCGGTHVAHTGDIGYFRILSETGIAAGVRRIEAVCGHAAVVMACEEQQQWQSLALQLKTPMPKIGDRLQQLLEKQRLLEKELEVAHLQLSRVATQQLLLEAKHLGNYHLLLKVFPGKTAKELRELYDGLKDRLQQEVLVFAGVSAEQVSLLVAVAKPLQGALRAGELVAFLAGQIGGKGGGRADMAQGGGRHDEAALATALQGVEAFCRQRLA